MGKMVDYITPPLQNNQKYFFLVLRQEKYFVPYLGAGVVHFWTTHSVGAGSDWATFLQNLLAPEA